MQAKTIAVTGKGGTGKTTTAAMIIRHLKEHAPGPILALDADPDANLATVLGIPVEKTIADLREDTLKEISNLPAGMSKSSYIEAGLHQIIEETDKVDLISMGRGEGPGCYCYINSLVRKFSEDLQGSYQWIVTDNEAGLEHLSRRTAGRIDYLVIVANASPLSYDCAERIVQLTSEMKNDVGKRYILLNSVSDQQALALNARVEHLGIECLGRVPFDSAIEQCILEGRSLFDVEGAPAVQKLDGIMKSLVGEF